METKKIISIIFIILVAIIAVIFIYQKNKSDADSIISFNPVSKNILINQPFSLDAQINPRKNKIAGVELHINFPADKIQCDSIIADSNKWNIMEQGKIDNTKGQASIIVGVIPSNGPITTLATVAILNCQAIENGSAKIIFDKKATKAAGVGVINSVIKEMTGMEVSIN